ncbi:CLUMA_CG016875, isoform A [Clunio marinus]|uniref:CLUMA_CG016875, isoform A n=1 Tax=Clunio marinus TaxID=568069 RepID=A0A1J1ISC8_9DIPT|nr:CLUMA_CG016875, isoform A [Clunio marinus]
MFKGVLHLNNDTLDMKMPFVVMIPLTGKGGCCEDTLEGEHVKSLLALGITHKGNISTDLKLMRLLPYQILRMLSKQMCVHEDGNDR